LESELDENEAEIARIMVRLPEFAWLESAETAKIRHEIRHKIAKTLQQYYMENTRMVQSGWSARFIQAGITEDDGKSAISCARRLGIEIS
jgi:(p)ppGpp synthase/HD superfamily hydrolase